MGNNHESKAEGNRVNHILNGIVLHQTTESGGDSGFEVVTVFGIGPHPYESHVNQIRPDHVVRYDCNDIRDKVPRGYISRSDFEWLIVPMHLYNLDCQEPEDDLQRLQYEDNTEHECLVSEMRILPIPELPVGNTEPSHRDVSVKRESQEEVEVPQLSIRWLDEQIVLTLAIDFITTSVLV